LLDSDEGGDAAAYIKKTPKGLQQRAQFRCGATSNHDCSQAIRRLVGLKAKGNDDEIFDNFISSMFFNKRDSAGFAAQGRQHAVGSGEAESATWLQACRNGQGD
jgi:hypothetical protein